VTVSPQPPPPPPPPPPPSGKTYSTNFDLTEFPISEGGVWQHTPNSFSFVRTEGGHAHSSNGSSTEYDDSYAYLTGFGPDQTAEGVIYRSPSLDTSTTHEVELLLRVSDDAGGARAYECLFSFYGAVDIVRWDGPMGQFTPLSLSGILRYSDELHSGDVIKATIVGNHISLYINGMLIAEATDSAYTTGQPGISFFTRGNDAHFGLTSYTVTSN
jgi:hypothetical protein